MVTKKIIDALYKQYRKPPKSIDDLPFSILFEHTADNHGLVIDEENLYIGSIDPRSPFSTIALRHINEIVEFHDQIAIVLHPSIIFLSKASDEIYINIKDEQLSFLDRVRMMISGEQQEPEDLCRDDNAAFNDFDTELASDGSRPS